MKYGFVVDSTVDVHQDVIDKHKVMTVPLSIIWGTTSYTDQGDLSTSEFFERLKTDDELPRSSAPSPAAFLTQFQKMIDEVDEVISINISSKLSGTVNAAKMSASMVNKNKIHVFDSMSVSIGSGIVLSEIVKHLENGGKIEDIQDVIDEVVSDLDIYIIVDDLDSLKRGGRIGAAKCFIGNLLKLKPVVGIKDGAVVPVDKIFGDNKIESYFEGLFSKWKETGRDLEYISLAYSNDKETIVPIEPIARKYYPEIKVHITQVSSVIGCHAGPGLIGLGVR